MLDAELAALVRLLAERGVPLVVAAQDRTIADRLRAALAAPTGGLISADSLERVLSIIGAPAPASGELPDEARDLGIVLVIDGGRVTAVHYVRPLERDAAGHLQRRPPVVLGARRGSSATLDHFYWAVTDELATRAGMTRADFEQMHETGVRQLKLGLIAMAAEEAPD